MTHTKPQKPLISYYGGKQRIASKIVEVIRTIPHKIYAEPFCGGCAVLFKKGYPTVSNQHDYREIINDNSELLINMYRVIQAQEKEFLHRIEYTLHSESEHRKAVEITKNPDSYSDMDLAWAYFVNISQSFNNELHSGFRRSLTSKNEATTWDNKKQRLPELINRFKQVQIYCTDALKFIKQCDHVNTLFYIDPPYPSTNQGHYKGYSQSDFIELIELLKTVKGSFILSNYPNDAVPSDWERIDIKATSSAAKGVEGQARESNKRTEVLWIKRNT